MKQLKYVIGLFLILFFFPSLKVEAREARASSSTVVQVDPATKRKVRRKRRRVRRRVKRRTLRRLPANTRAVVFRNVSYYPVNGMYYLNRRGAYVRTFPPRGFRTRTIPGTFTRLMVRGSAYAYTQGVFYQQMEDGAYEIVAPPTGAIIEQLPEDAEEIDFDGIPTYELNETLYRAIEDGYEVIGESGL
ncbi:MAG: DUF6515 family protein [Saonia sp.]